MAEYENLDKKLWDIAESCMPEVRALDEYRQESSAFRASWAMLEAALTEVQMEPLREIEECLNAEAAMESRLMHRKIYFYGLAQGIEIGRRSRNGRIPVFAKP
ncbi:MAG: hypothetical protein LBL73_07040 [Synergistaceae bacterium]|jgi:hypothetical protein|nr:hypothetical protein [Synergistaceae bacterium]